MRFATLIPDRRAQTRIARALAAKGIEVVPFTSVAALVGALSAHAFAAIVVEDHAARIDQWLTALQPQLMTHTALIVMGAGGATGMSRALLHGADDYVIDSDEPEHLVQRAIARISVKLRASQRSTLQVGPYTLNIAHGAMLSPTTQVRLTAREIMFARMLFEQRGQLVTTERLCHALCGRVDASAERAVKQHAYELRRKLQQVVGDNADTLRIETVYGQGYRLAW